MSAARNCRAPASAEVAAIRNATAIITVRERPARLHTGTYTPWDRSAAGRKGSRRFSVKAGIVKRRYYARHFYELKPPVEGRMRAGNKAQHRVQGAAYKDDLQGQFSKKRISRVVLL
jgi:hypothetical protein